MVSNVLGWLCVRLCVCVWGGGGLWLFLHHLFLVSLSLQSPCLCAVCDVGFENNKCLDPFRSHVKPGEGHALSKTSTDVGGSLTPWVRFWEGTLTPVER